MRVVTAPDISPKVEVLPFMKRCFAVALSVNNLLPNCQKPTTSHNLPLQRRDPCWDLATGRPFSFTRFHFPAICLEARKMTGVLVTALRFVMQLLYLSL